MSKVSACVLTYNEERNLPRLLSHLDFCDEIVVLDSFSADQTPQIAKAHPKVKFVQETFKGFRTQKNRLLELASHEWVLCLDSDEYLDKEAERSVQSVLKEPGSTTVYRLPRKCVYLGRWIRHGGWYPDYQIRFFRKTDAQWGGQETHEYVVPKTASIGQLSGNIIHTSFRDIAHQVEKNNFYTSRIAQQLVQESRFSILTMCVRPLVTFVRMYFLRLGFLDGIPGLIVCVNSATSTFLKYAKAWERQKEDVAAPKR